MKNMQIKTMEWSQNLWLHFEKRASLLFNAPVSVYRCMTNEYGQKSVEFCMFKDYLSAKDMQSLCDMFDLKMRNIEISFLDSVFFIGYYDAGRFF